MHFKKWQKRWEWYIYVEGDYFQGDGDRPKLVFAQIMNVYTRIWGLFEILINNK
jgi:hypothetical protein